MKQVTCIYKFRENNKIVGYQIATDDGSSTFIEADRLKQGMQSGKIRVTNLHLTSDFRIIDTNSHSNNPLSFDTLTPEREEKIKQYVAKMRLMGRVTELPTYSEKPCFMVSLSERNHILYIPENVELLNKYTEVPVFTKHIRHYQGTMRVIGGRGLKSTDTMFYACNINHIDFTLFSTENVESMDAMFLGCNQIGALDLSTFNTQKVTTMENMFYLCSARYINLSSFETPKLRHMEGMFRNCAVKKLDLRPFQTDKVTSMKLVFESCKAEEIDLTGFDTHNVRDMSNMFKKCSAKTLNLSSFNTKKVKLMNRMFEGIKIKTLDLRSFRLSNIQKMEFMFKESVIECIDLSKSEPSSSLVGNARMFEEARVKRVKVNRRSKYMIMLLKDGYACLDEKCIELV